MANSYTLNYYGANGNSTLQLEVGTAGTFGIPSANSSALQSALANTSGIRLMGRNFTSSNTTNGYGWTFNENYVRLTENFANTYANHSNANIYPQFITGQLIFETTPAPNAAANVLYLFTSTGNYATASKIEILSNVNPPKSIAWGNSNIAIETLDGNISATANGTPNAFHISSTGLYGSGNITFNIGTNFEYDYVNGGLGNVTADRFYANVASNGAGQFYGNGSSLEDLTGANVVGNVATALYAYEVAGANVTGQVANANIADRVYNNAQPNITSVGTLTSLTASGSITSTVNSTVPPFVVASNFKVANLNVDLLDGYDSSIPVVASTVVVRDTNGSIAANGITANTIGGTLTTAAQPNITSVGTLTSLTVGAGGITGELVTAIQPFITTLSNSNVTISGNLIVSGNIQGTVQGNASSNVGGGNANFTTSVTSPTANFTTSVTSPTANFTTSVTSPTATFTTSVAAPTATITTINANTGGSTFGGAWTLGPGATLQSTYADLAEYYTCETTIAPGTVVEFGGPQEIRICDTDMSTRVAGVVSTEPAYIMNQDFNGTTIREMVALIGRVPCKVYGVVAKGDMMVATGGGYARAEANPVVGSVIGKALENKATTGAGVIEVVVGRV